MTEPARGWEQYADSLWNRVCPHGDVLQRSRECPECLNDSFRAAYVAGHAAGAATMAHERDEWRIACESARTDAARWESDYHKKDAHHEACVTQRDAARAEIKRLHGILAALRTAPPTPNP